MSGASENKHYVEVITKELVELEQGLKVLNAKRERSRKSIDKKNEKEGKEPQMRKRKELMKLKIVQPSDIVFDYCNSGTANADIVLDYCNRNKNNDQK